MPTFHHDGIELAFRDEGEGDPILLIHGFGSSTQVNWVGPGWFDVLKADERRVIAIDNRGHGASQKLYDSAFYGTDLMAGDALALLDHLGVKKADVMGYSMGGRIAAWMAIHRGERMRSCILGGLGEAILKGAANAEAIADGMLAPSIDDVVNPMAKTFRRFADVTDADRKALAACMRMQRHRFSETELATISVPTLVAIGTEDDVSGALEPLVALIPGAEGLAIPRRDHNRAVGDKVYKQGVLSFLERRP